MREISIAAMCAAAMAGLALPAVAFATEDQASRIIVTVNAQPITRRDVDLMLLTRQVPKALWPSVRKIFVERLIDNRLMRAFLTGQKIVPKPEQLDAAVRRVHRQIRGQGGDPKAVLKQYGLDDEALKRELWIPVAWAIYARQVVTDREIRERFTKRRLEFDGTEVRASQIFLKLPADADQAAKKRALERLRQIRGEVLSGQIRFAQAAQKHSQSPSGRKGGDVGFFGYRGKMPRAFARAAFALKKGEVSQPFLTDFGAHLIQLTDIRPGQLSLEDVRSEIFGQLAQQRWDETVARLRKSAKIIWNTKR